MRHSILIACACLVLIACGPSRLEREGQRIFAGCARAVDDAATLQTGFFVCKGERDPAPFAGNGRACGSCHIPGDNFALAPFTVSEIPADDPLFFPLDENPILLRTHALIRVIAPGIDEFRTVPKLIHLRKLCDRKGNCDALGNRGDRLQNLDAFTIQAIENHLSKTIARVPGEDFRVPTARELKAITAYQISRLVSDQDERLDTKESP